MLYSKYMPTIRPFRTTPRSEEVWKNGDQMSSNVTKKHENSEKKISHMSSNVTKKHENWNHACDCVIYIIFRVHAASQLCWCVPNFQREKQKHE